jgi:hypothetical protein
MFKDLREKWNRRPKRKQKISYGRKIRYNWDTIESVNSGLGITRDTCYVGNNGYLRWKSNDQLCHRDIAFTYNYHKYGYTRPFSEYDVHHMDENKFNNHPDNLQIVLREVHQIEHKQILYRNGVKYIKLVRANVRRKETHKAILIGGKRGTWYPKTQLLIQDGYIYASEWIYQKKRN